MGKIVKRILSLILVTFMICSMLPMEFVFAADTMVEFDGGDGTKGNPYQISTADQLNAIREDLDANYILKNNIDLSNWGHVWIPIGGGEKKFSGSLNGNNFAINGLVVNRDNAGLFGCIDGAGIYNLGITNCNIKGQYSGGLACVIYDSEIINCYVTGSITGVVEVGGLVCSVYYGSNIEYCWNGATITLADDNLGGLHIGGLVGKWTTSTLDNNRINSCYNEGNIRLINGKGNYYYLGGLVGGVYGSNKMEIVNSYNNGSINAHCVNACIYAGGLIGEANASTNITTSYNRGNIYASAYDEYNILLITADLLYLSGGTVNINQCYYSSYCSPKGEAVNRLDYGGGGHIEVNESTELSDADAMKQSSYQGFDFEKDWLMETYPVPRLYEWKYEGAEKPEPETISKSVKYFSSWDAENQTAYWGESDYVGSKVTDETDTSFMENLENLLNHYVLVETKNRNDGMVDSDYLISIKPVESKKGTVSATDATSIVIDDSIYALTEWMEMPEVYVNSPVLYHLFEGEIVGIEALTAKNGTFQEWNVDTRELTIATDDLNANETVYILSNLVDETTVKLLETIEHHTDIKYVIDNNKFVYQINEIIGGTETGLELKDIIYFDDLEKVTKEAQVYWGSVLFNNDARNIETAKPDDYSNLVKVSALLSQCSYDLSKGGDLNQALNELGVADSDIEWHYGDSLNEPGHTFSYMNLNVNGITTQRVLVVTVRGSSHWTDWITDCEATTDPYILGYPKEHLGFSIARDIIKRELMEYISKKGIDTSTTKILITGHSYGGAVANLLAKSVEDIFEKSNIFGYTFASPNNIVVRGTNGVSLGSNIHNFRNAWDPVTMVPLAPLPEEVYTIYGQQHYFQIEDAGEESEGIDVKENHNCTHYVNYVLKMPEESTLVKVPLRTIRIRCPIDVEAYDKNGNLVGSISNNQVNEDVTKIMMIPVGDEKDIFIPVDGSVRLSLVATDAGTMEVSICDYDIVSGKVSAIKEFSNVALMKEKMFDVNVTNEVATAAISLDVVDEEGNKLATVNEDGSETPEKPVEEFRTWKYQFLDGMAVVQSYKGNETSVEIPTSVEYNGETYEVKAIGNSAFDGNTYLQSVTIPENITKLGKYAFRNCTNLNKVIFEGDLDTDSGVFYNAGRDGGGITVIFGDKVTRIPDYLFDSYSERENGNYVRLKKIQMSDSIKEVGQAAFAGCLDIEEIVWSNNLEKIYPEAFEYNESLKEIVLPESVKYIGMWAFDSCSKVEKITTPNRKEVYVEDCAFSQCISLNKLIIKGDLGNHLVDAPMPGDSFFEEADVFANAGANAEKLEIIFEEGVTIVPDGLFDTTYYVSEEEYPHVTSVQIPSTVEEIGIESFAGCKDMKKAIIQGEQVEFGNNSFLKTTTIYGYADSYVEKQAIKYGIPFVVLEEEVKLPFTDIKETDYYYDAVLWAVEQGITTGKDATHFLPDGVCTRAQVVTFLWRANGKPEPTIKNPFVDVDGSKHYYKAVLWALENGITQGKDATHFQPDVTVNRGQVVTFMWRAEGKPEPTVSNPFVDVPKGSYYEKAVLWAYENEITLGKDATHFQPEKECIRAQVVTFLYRNEH